MTPLGPDGSEIQSQCHGEKQGPVGSEVTGASHKSGLVLVSVFLFSKVRINGPFLYPEGGGQAAGLQTPNGFHLDFRK